MSCLHNRTQVITWMYQNKINVLSKGPEQGQCLVCITRHRSWYEGTGTRSMSCLHDTTQVMIRRDRNEVNVLSAQQDTGHGTKYFCAQTSKLCHVCMLAVKLKCRERSVLKVIRTSTSTDHSVIFTSWRQRAHSSNTWVHMSLPPNDTWMSSAGRALVSVWAQQTGRPHSMQSMLSMWCGLATEVHQTEPLTSR